MTTIIMLLMFPIGLYTYFVIEKRNKKEYQAVFDNFQRQIAMKKIPNKEKVALFEQMLLQNGYEIVGKSDEKVIGEKKVLSMALMMIGLGVYIIGIFFYLAYYFWFQKPHVVEFAVYEKAL